MVATSRVAASAEFVCLWKFQWESSFRTTRFHPLWQSAFQFRVCHGARKPTFAVKFEWHVHFVHFGRTEQSSALALKTGSRNDMFAVCAESAVTGVDKHGEIFFLDLENPADFRRGTLDLFPEWEEVAVRIQMTLCNLRDTLIILAPRYLDWDPIGYMYLRKRVI